MNNNMFISIGSKCNVRHQISKHFKYGETMFFDWLGTDMDTVNIILQTSDITNYFSPCNIIEEPNTLDASHARLAIKNLPKCISVHDVRKNYNSRDIDTFITKYKRRFDRLLQIIKSNNKLFFIRYGKIDNYQKELFIKTILKINPNCNFVLISVKDEQPYNKIQKSNHYIEFNYKVKQVADDWTTSWLDWDNIFKVLMET